VRWKQLDYLSLIVGYYVATYHYFFDLPVYKTCRAFRKKISTIARKFFPKPDDFHLKAQVVDSSRSVTVNIVEGLERFWKVSSPGEYSVLQAIKRFA
jgi:hypothetical protein